MARQHAEAPTTKALVLVVHANAGHGRLAESLLEGAGHEVVSASEPDEVAALAKYGQPDLVVVDGGDAPALATALAATLTVPVLIVASDGGGEHGSGRDPSRCSLGTLLDEVSRYLTAPARSPRSTGRGSSE